MTEQIEVWKVTKKIEVWKETRKTATVTTFDWWQKDEALKFAQNIAHNGIKVFVFDEKGNQIWSNQ